MTQLNGIDISYHALTLPQAQALRRAGYDVLAQCLWTGAHAPAVRVQNLRNAQQAGFPYLMGYISLSSSHGGAYHVNKAKAGFPPDLWQALVRAPIDIELEGIPNAAIREAVDMLAAEGKKRTIYTAHFAWVGYQGNPKTFTDCELWNAFWDGSSDVDFQNYPYGGWAPAQVVGEQYTGGEFVEGVYADRNVWVKELLDADEGEDMPRVEEVRTELLGYIGAELMAIAKQGELIDALGNGLASVAQTVARLATLSGDSSTTQQGVLGEMQAELEHVKAMVEEQRRRAVAAAEIVLKP